MTAVALALCALALAPLAYWVHGPRRGYSKTGSPKGFRLVVSLAYWTLIAASVVLAVAEAA